MFSLRTLLTVGGAVAVAALAAWLYAGRELPRRPAIQPPTAGSAAPLQLATQPTESGATGAASAAISALTVPAVPVSAARAQGQAFDTAFARATKENIAQTVHRASASRALPDILSARLARLACSANYTPPQIQLIHPKADSRIVERAALFEKLCDMQGQWQQLSGQMAAVVQGLPRGSLEARLAGADGSISDEQRIELMRFAFNSQSLTLVDYVAAHFGRRSMLPALGLPASQSTTDQMDLYLFQWATKILACQQIKDCDSPWATPNLCLDRGDCVDSAADYPVRYIYGPRTDAVFHKVDPWFKLSPAVRQKRWEEVLAWTRAQAGG